MEKLKKTEEEFLTLKKKFRLVTLAHKKDNQSFLSLIPTDVLYLIFKEISEPNYALSDLRREHGFLSIRVPEHEIRKHIPLNSFLRKKCVSEHTVETLLSGKGLPHLHFFNYRLKWGKEDMNQFLRGVPLINVVSRLSKLTGASMYLKALVQHGANIDPSWIPDFFSCDVDPSKVLEWNRTNGAHFAIKSLLKGDIPFCLFEMIIKFCDVNVFKKGRSIVHRAFLSGNYAIVRCLVENGAKVDFPDSFGNTIFEEEAYKISQFLKKKRKIEKK